jgi:ankyrin repeat protein
MLIKTIKILIASLSIFIFSGCGLSIHDAAEKGDLDFLVSELKKGVDINRKNLTGSTPLHSASKEGKLNVVNYILKKRGEVDAVNSFRKTPLHVAAANGHLNIVKVLLENGAKISSNDNHGNTPLLCAAEKGQIQVVKFLLSEGASGRYKNAFSESALRLASKNGHMDVAELLQDYKPSKRVVSFKRSVQNSVKDTDPPRIEIYTPAQRGIRLISKAGQITISGKVFDRSRVKRFLLDGKNVILDRSNNFKVNATLIDGANSFRFQAIDIYNNSSVKNLDIEGRKRNKAVSGSYHALIIGNNEYANMPNLKTAVNDAKVIEKVLRQRYGFNTRLLLNSTKLSISRAINSFRKRLTSNDHFLIYYAGHGYFDKEVNKAYWWPVDAETDDDTNWIISDTITTNIKRVASKHVLIIADSCYSGTLTRSFNVSLKTGVKSSLYLEKMMNRSSRTLLASGGNEPVSDSGGKGHSVFAASLIHGLKNRTESIFTAENLFYENIKETVSGRSSQVPQYSIIRNSGHGGGDFVFRKKELK